MRTAPRVDSRSIRDAIWPVGSVDLDGRTDEIEELLQSVLSTPPLVATVVDFVHANSDKTEPDREGDETMGHRPRLDGTRYEDSTLHTGSSSES